MESCRSPIFETSLGAGYFQIDLSAFNWNSARQSGHKLDPVGMTPQGLPVKRQPAAAVLANLTRGGQDRDKQIARISHPALKRLLAQEPEGSPANFVAWLQKSVRSGLVQIGNHPADQVRKRMLEEFAATPVERFLAADDRQSIPQTIGVRCAVLGSPSQYDVARADRDGRVFQHYMTDPHWRAVYVGYRAHDGTVDRSHPVLLFVNQIWAVTQREGTKETPLKVAPDSPLRGRALGSSKSLKEFRVSWEAALEEYCRTLGLFEPFRVVQGAIIEKTDGTYFQLRNFDKGKAWMRGSPFRNIRRVYRSPLRFLKDVRPSD